jgi:2',3'-cyclic-nucleotide 2'-phosphodiesterase / 3'-nucleotidase / 5'-nucleotidase
MTSTGNRSLSLASFVAVALAACTTSDNNNTPASTLTAEILEPAGSNCAAGGRRVESGADTDHDGKLDPNEVKTTKFECNPDPALARRAAWALTADATSQDHHSADLVNNAPVGNGRITLQRLGRSPYNALDFTRATSEIVDYNPVTKQVFAHDTRFARVGYYKLTTTGLTDHGEINPALNLTAEAPSPRYGVGVNSCAVADNTLAVAVEIFDFQERVHVDGYVSFYDVSGGGVPVFIKAVKVGPQPDSLVFTHDAKKVLVAGEGEATMQDKNGTETTAKDPEGSISVITRPAGGWKSVSNADTVTLWFQDFNDDGPRAGDRPPELHPIGPAGTTWSQMFEPEYIAPSPDDRTAWVVLQEMNAIMVLELASSDPSAEVPRIREIRYMGVKDGLLPGNEFDASDFDGLDPLSPDVTVHGRVRIANWPVYLLYQPDTIKAYTAVNGKTYYVTANEGDPRNEDWGWHENEKVGALKLDPKAFPGVDVDVLKRNDMLGRLMVTKTAGDADGDGLYENLYAFGGRSFSVWDEAGKLVFDSGNEMERITAKLYGEYYNDYSKEFLPEGNSPWKGPEPEALSIGKISVPKRGGGGNEDRWFAFIGSEKISGWWIYDITDPTNTEFVSYFSNRHPELSPDQDTEADLGPEGSVFVPAADSPTGKPLLIMGNEVSSTTGVYEIIVRP